MKINNFQGDVTDISAKNEALFTTALGSLECMTPLSTDQCFLTLDRQAGLLITLSTTGERNGSIGGRKPGAFQRNCALYAKTQGGREREANKNHNRNLFVSSFLYGQHSFAVHLHLNGSTPADSMLHR